MARILPSRLVIYPERPLDASHSQALRHSGHCTCVRVIQASQASQKAAVVRSGRQRLRPKSVGGIHQVSEGWIVKEDGLADVQSEWYSPYPLLPLSRPVHVC
jgi:hypothetical protein